MDHCHFLINQRLLNEKHIFPEFSFLLSLICCLWLEQFNNHNFSKTFQVLSICLPYVFWKVFSAARMKCFFRAQKLKSCCFWECRFWRTQRSQCNNQTFSKIFSAMEYLSIRKNIFSATPVKCFFNQGSNNWYSVVFRNKGSGGIKDHSTTKTHFQKKISPMEVLDMFLPYVKRYFQHEWIMFFFMA